MKKLYLPPGARLLKLQLKLKGEVEYKSYQVTLLTVEGAEKWSQDMLRAKRTGSGRSIDLWLPTRILAQGDYELRLKGYASGRDSRRDGRLLLFECQSESDPAITDFSIPSSAYLPVKYFSECCISR